MKYGTAYIVVDGKKVEVNSKEAKAHAKEYANSYHAIPEAIDTTEKSVKCEVTVLVGKNSIEKKATVWFPKSQIVKGKVKGWLINAKRKDLHQAFGALAIIEGL